MNSSVIDSIYRKQEAFFQSGATRSYAFRRQQLIRLKKLIQSYEQDILQALAMDMRKPAQEAFISEIGFVYEEINFTLQHLKKWMRPTPVPTPLALQLSSSVIYHEPRGLTCILAPWNYPFQLIFSPLVGAIAGGNCAILKPSEFTIHTSALMAKMIAEAFDESYIALLEGDGKEIGNYLLSQFHFGLVFFTGSTVVGKEIMRLAAQQLSPVVLELGGKSPAIIAPDASLSLAARQLVWAKFFNAGQTCVSPDYVLVHEDQQELFVAEMIKHIQSFYGDDALLSPDYTSIVNEAKFNRLLSMLDGVNILYGGNSNRDWLRIEPSIVSGIPHDHPLMKEEIFGPILPILTYRNREDCFSVIAQHANPLALYLFTHDKKWETEVLNKIPFGGGCINNALVHLANPHLPFGGIAASGMGNYHGRFSFEVFTHQKAIIKTSTLFDPPLRYAPYTKLKMKLAKWLFSA